MLIAELTIEDSNLNNILRAVLVNESPGAVNTQCRDILVKDILESKPDVLVNCYTLQELEDSFKILFDKDYHIVKAKEIVPNSFNLGLVRDLNICEENYKGLNVNKRFKYYFMLKSKKENSYIFCITYNPDIQLQKQINVKLEKGVIRCSTLQVLFTSLSKRNIEIVKRINTEQGNLCYYDLKVGEQDGIL